MARAKVETECRECGLRQHHYADDQGRPRPVCASCMVTRARERRREVAVLVRALPPEERPDRRRGLVEVVFAPCRACGRTPRPHRRTARAILRPCVTCLVTRQRAYEKDRWARLRADPEALKRAYEAQRERRRRWRRRRSALAKLARKRRREAILRRAAMMLRGQGRSIRAIARRLSVSFRVARRFVTSP